MLPLWMMPFIFEDERVFSYEHEQLLYIKGKRIAGEWVIDIHANAHTFVWGANKLKTGISGPFSDVVKRYAMQLLNDLTVYGIRDGRDRLISLIKGSL